LRCASAHVLQRPLGGEADALVVGHALPAFFGAGQLRMVRRSRASIAAISASVIPSRPISFAAARTAATHFAFT
jgi:hypothetical protein